MGGRKSLTVWVQNKGEATPVFLRAHLPAECTQIKIEGISVVLCGKQKKIISSFVLIKQLELITLNEHRVFTPNRLLSVVNDLI